MEREYNKNINVERESICTLHCGVELYDSPGTMSRVDRGLLVPTELVKNTFTV